MKLQNAVLTVIFPDGSNKNLSFRSGDRILDVLTENGVKFDAPCGGNGRCGRCRAVVSGDVSEPDDGERKLLASGETAAGTRLLCFCRGLGDCRVTLPENGGTQIQTDSAAGEVKPEPEFSVRRFALTTPTLADQVSLLDNIRRGLGEPEAQASTAALRRALTLRESGWAVLRGRLITDIRSEKPRLYGCATDIGTTTVVTYIYDLETGERLGAVSALSAQRGFGADVISRIQASSAGELENLRKAVTGQLDAMAGELASRLGIEKTRIYSMSVCGNTTMEHLLCGLDPAGIAAAPFTAVSLFGYSLPAAELGIGINESAEVYILPCVSGYVGGDITAGVLACGVHTSEKPCLLLDIGTNGETALGAGGKIFCCSTAAGPAFEGAHISDGVGGIEGAISRVAIEDGKIVFETIGGKPPVGICGSGIIDALAVMLAAGAVDETGRLVDPDEIKPEFSDRLDDENRKFIIDPASGIGLTDKDVRQIQLAKAAIAAGIETLTDRAEFGGKHITFDDIGRVCLAGGFGTHISKESACAIGLLPKKLLPRVQAVGNSAGAGASMALLAPGTRAELEKMPSEGIYIELSSDPDFNDRYIENMCFDV